MFERFTEQAKNVVTTAQDEASYFKHDYLGPEHLLLGLSRGEGIAARALTNSGVKPEIVRERLGTIVGFGEEDTTAKPFTQPAKNIFVMALEETQSFGHDYIEPEHLLLALVSESENVAVAMLADLHVDREELHAEVLSMIDKGR